MQGLEWRQASTGLYIPSSHQADVDKVASASNLEIRSTRAVEWQAWATVAAVIVGYISLLLSINSLKAQQNALADQQQQYAKQQQQYIDQQRKDESRYAEEVSVAAELRGNSIFLVIRNPSPVLFEQVAAAAPSMELNSTFYNDSYWVDLGNLEPCSVIEAELTSYSGSGHWDPSNFIFNTILKFSDPSHSWIIDPSGGVREAIGLEDQMGPGEGFTDVNTGIVSHLTRGQDKSYDFEEIGTVKRAPKRLSGC